MESHLFKNSLLLILLAAIVYYSMYSLQTIPFLVYPQNPILIRIIYFIPVIILLFLTIRPLSRLKTNLSASPNDITKANVEYFVQFSFLALGFTTLLIYGVSFFPLFTTWQESRTDQLQYLLGDFLTSLLFLLVVVGILAPLAEEIIFRYLVVNLLEKYSDWSIGLKAGLATWCFWIVHFLWNPNLFGMDPNTNTLMLEVMCGGIFYFVLYYKLRSLIFPIVFHMFWNSLQSFYIILDQFFIGREAVMALELLVALVVFMLGFFLTYQKRIGMFFKNGHEVWYLTLQFTLSFSFVILISLGHQLFYLTLLGGNPFSGSFLSTLTFAFLIFIILTFLEKKNKNQQVNE
ncbi:MAG: lysostaphin resistance A-like protein [Candidatus Hodarchaeota archaeon]